MQITLNQDEIEIAIAAYVHKQINIADGLEISIEFKAGRGENGHTATLDVRPASVEVKPTSRAETTKAETPAVKPAFSKSPDPAATTATAGSAKPSSVFKPKAEAQPAEKPADDATDASDSDTADAVEEEQQEQPKAPQATSIFARAAAGA